MDLQGSVEVLKGIENIFAFEDTALIRDVLLLRLAIQFKILTHSQYHDLLIVISGKFLSCFWLVPPNSPINITTMRFAPFFK